MNKLGAQCQMRKSDLLDYCHVVHPRAAMGINVRDRGFYEGLPALGVKGVYRHHPNEGWHDPEDNARRFVRDFLVPETATFIDILPYVLGYNEYVHAAPLMSDEARDRADRFASTFIKEVHEQLGCHAIVLNLNTGHFRDDILCFHRTLAALDDCGVCRLGMHEYGWPFMYTQYADGLVAGNDGCWHTLRYKVAMKAIKGVGYDNVKVVMSECGVDGGVVGQGGQGWRKIHDNFNVALLWLKQSLAWYLDAIGEDDDVDFALWFGVGMNDDWRGRGFELPREIWQWVADYK